MPALHTTHHLQAVLCNQIPHLAETLEVPLAAQTHGPAPYRTTAIEKQQGVMLRSHFLAESSKYMRLFTGRDFTKVTVRTTSSNTRTRCAGKVQTLVWFPTYVLLFPGILIWPEHIRSCCFLFCFLFFFLEETLQNNARLQRHTNWITSQGPADNISRHDVVRKHGSDPLSLLTFLIFTSHFSSSFLGGLFFFSISIFQHCAMMEGQWY